LGAKNLLPSLLNMPRIFGKANGILFYGNVISWRLKSYGRNIILFFPNLTGFHRRALEDP
jgi:hypothetical protein